MKYYGHADYIDQNDSRQEKWRKQREESGFDDTEIWNLDWTLMEFMIPRLKLFREKCAGMPCGIPELKHWHMILDRIIEGFELYMANWTTIEELKYNQRKFDIAMKLFSKWFGALWS